MCKEAARPWGDLICWSWCGTKIFVLDSVRCSWFITANTDRVEQVVVVKGTGWIVAAGGDERPKLCLLSMGQPRSVNCCGWGVTGICSSAWSQSSWVGLQKDKVHWLLWMLLNRPNNATWLTDCQCCLSSLPPGCYTLLPVGRGQALPNRFTCMKGPLDVWDVADWQSKEGVLVFARQELSSRLV